MKSMKQPSLTETGFLPKAGKQTRKAVFPSEMKAVVPWSRLEAPIESFYKKKGNGRLRIVQHDVSDSLHAPMV